MDQPTWLAAAWRELGQTEVAGPGENPRIVRLYAEAGHPQVRHDEVAWCAAFVGACLEHGGIRCSRSLMARSYARWGTPLSAARFGAIAVLSRTSDPALGHVGFVVGETADKIYLLGGNQGDAVSVAAFDRARVVAMRWPGASAGDVPPKPEQPADRSLFDEALAHVLEMEGGYGDDPFDPGGPTNFGITLEVFARWRGETLDATSRERLKDALKRISPDVVREIYLKRYWTPARCADLPPAIAFMHFDASVNHGVGTAIRILQEALGVDRDGEIGPMTLAAVLRQPVETTLEAYAELRRRRYRALAQFWRFGRGWLRRVETTRTRALTIAARKIPPTPQPQSTGDLDMPMTQPMTQPTTQQTRAPTKWWGQSLTVWGAIVTALATVLPLIGPLIGFDISADTVHQVSDQLVTIGQLVTGLIGTLMTIYGRSRALGPLVLRDVSLRV
jgi:uncharacterized protein (TIGR02594 family)